MIFGTDGLRSRMGSYPLDQETIETLSHVLAEHLPENAEIVIARDTRSSGPTIQNWITANLGPIQVTDLGIVPTPVCAYETRARGAHLGIMITASHNPHHDNGLKFFDRNGLKLRYDIAAAWSKQVEAGVRQGEPLHMLPKPAEPEHYKTFLKNRFPQTAFQNLRCLFDLANGAGAPFVQERCAELGIQAQFLGNQPDGSNINEGVGALHPEALKAAVKKAGAQVGFALDGDADRLIVVGPEKIYRGDVVLYALKEILQKEGVTVEAVVGTIMCGMGLESKLLAEGIRLVRTPVGDQNVLAEMVAHDLPLGGEPSGHLIIRDLFLAGDGFLAALKLAVAIAQDPDLLERSDRAVPEYQVFEKAIPVAHKPAIEQVPLLYGAVEALRDKLGSAGRLIVRYSGTEPKIRLYVEAQDLTPYQEEITRIQTAVQEELS